MNREIVSRLIDRYEVITIGQESDVIVWGAQEDYRFKDGRSVKTLSLLSPQSNRKQAANLVQQYCQKHKVDYIIGHWDVWVLPFLNDVGFPFATYIPIDANLTQRWVKFMQGAHKTIAYSRFGYEQLKRYFRPSEIAYVPHGVDTQTFKPDPNMNRDEIRKKLPTNMPIPEGAFLFVSVQANMGPRKELPNLLGTFKRFVDEHPDAHIYLHTNSQSDAPYGYDITALADEFGIGPNVHWPRSNPILEPASDQELNELYNAADVYISSSAGEGFGLPVLEAMSSGLPVIVPNNSSHTELVKEVGWLVKTIDTDDHTDFPVYVPTLQQNVVPSQKDMFNCMNEAYYNSKKRREYSRLSRERAVNEYSWEKVMPLWYRLLDEVNEELSMFGEVMEALKVKPSQPASLVIK